ncbi:hypothetical protein L596_002522 [Steinernema carpocapsae]|uniref:Hint domain-containing protein n=1 Tax=Steinernema carpocapsae TaxID=34508 RepID=A0A4V6I7H0_STECR|nr:hypothetical protein L596_002522 [Steinernema carpocapsae]
MMSDLMVGDMVLVPASRNVLKYERVEMFYHRSPKTVMKFITIETVSGKRLSLTELHLLPFGKCSDLLSEELNIEHVEDVMRKSRFAYKAKEGDCVVTIDESNTLKVEEIRRTGRKYSKGIYSPMTVEGALIVNDMLASCFSQLESHAVQKIVFDFLLIVRNTFGYLSGMAHHAVQDIPTFIDYVHQFSWYILPFSKY